MKVSEKGMNIEKISLNFKSIMNKGSVNGALQLSTENMSNGLLPLKQKQKHPEANEPFQEVLLQRQTRSVHPVVYEDTNESLILKAAILRKGEKS